MIRYKYHIFLYGYFWLFITLRIKWLYFLSKIHIFSSYLWKNGTKNISRKGANYRITITRSCWQRKIFFSKKYSPVTSCYFSWILNSVKNWYLRHKDLKSHWKKTQNQKNLSRIWVAIIRAIFLPHRNVICSNFVEIIFLFRQ